jgi:predicted small secreted protein
MAVGATVMLNTVVAEELISKKQSESQVLRLATNAFLKTMNSSHKL